MKPPVKWAFSGVSSSRRVPTQYSATSREKLIKTALLAFLQIGVNKFAAIIALVTHEPKSPDNYKDLLKEHEELVHVTVEVHKCDLHEAVAA
jgi:hypothetical protein